MKLNHRLSNFLICSILTFYTTSIRAKGFYYEHEVAPSIVPQKSEHPPRPFRLGVIKINPKLDQVKPLELQDLSSWSYSNSYFFGSYNKEWFGAFAEKDQSPRWWLKTESDVTIPAAVFGKGLILGQRNGALWKIDSNTGERVWSLTLDSFPSRTINKYGSQILVVTARQTLYAIDYLSGKVSWAYHGPDQEEISVQDLSSPLVYNKNVYLGFSNGEVHGVSLSTGNKVWSYTPEYSSDKFKDSIGELFVLQGSLVVSYYKGSIHQISLDDANKSPSTWKSNIQLNSITDSKYFQGRLYAGTQNGYLYAIDPFSGATIWKYATGASINRIITGDFGLLSVSTSGIIIRHNVQNGIPIWTDRLEGVISPQLITTQTNDKIFISTGLKVFYGYKL